MRSILVSVALLALAQSLAPGVHGAPAAVSDHTNELVARQGIVGSLVGLISALSGLVGGSIPDPQLQQVIQQVLQKLESNAAAATGMIPRAQSSLASSAPLTTPSPFLLTTPSISLVTPTASNTSSVSSSTSQGLSNPASRMRRQSPTPPPVPSGKPSLPVPVPSPSILVLSLPIPVPSAKPSVIASILQPLESVVASILAGVSGKLQSAASKPTSSKSSLSPSQT